MYLRSSFVVQPFVITTRQKKACNLSLNEAISDARINLEVGGLRRDFFLTPNVGAHSGYLLWLPSKSAAPLLVTFSAHKRPPRGRSFRSSCFPIYLIGHNVSFIVILIKIKCLNAKCFFLWYGENRKYDI